LALIKSYAIPPAWRDVKIYIKSKKIFATGYDVKGRLQYKYTREHDNKKSQEKFCNQLNFAKYIPKIKRDIDKSLKKKKLTREKLIALIVKIILICNFRIGTESMLKNNNSYGISTICKHQVSFKNNNAIIDFIGKKGVRNTCIIVDKEVNDILKTMYNSKTNREQLFNVVENGKKFNVGILDVNAFLKRYNIGITTKDFRTWTANTLLLNYVIALPISDKTTHRKKTLKLIIEKVAVRLHHTPAVCKKRYLLNDLLQLYIDKPVKFKKFVSKEKTKSYDEGELTFIKYLKHHCK